MVLFFSMLLFLLSIIGLGWISVTTYKDFFSELHGIKNRTVRIICSVIGLIIILFLLYISVK